MEKIKFVLRWLLDHWKSISAAIAALIAAIAVLFGVNSCGSVVKATIRTPKDSTANTISISTNNPVSVTPDINTNPTITINPKNSK